jgi:hypothetical protein
MSGHIATRDYVRPNERGAYFFDTPKVLTDTVCLGYGDETKLGEHCKILTVPRHPSCLTKERWGARLVGWTVGMVFVCRKCVCNAHNALCNRHGVKQLPVVRDLQIDALDDFLDVLRSYWVDCWNHPLSDPDTWLSKWQRGKQLSFKHSQRWDKLAPNRVKSMIKWEVYSKVPSKARLIQFYSNLATQAEWGPVFSAVQKVICGRFRQCQIGGIDVTMASGMNANDVSKWMRDCAARGALMWYERDGKNWDSTMGEMTARFKRALYAAFDSSFTKFVEDCEKVKAIMVLPTGVFRYAVEFTVKSGHNDTTLGNNIINAAITYSVFKRLNVRCSILVAGDDLLVACYDKVVVGDVTSMEKEYGIMPEARVFDHPWQTSFISGIFMDVKDVWYFVPTPGRLLHRLWWTVNPPSDRKLAAYQRGVVLGLKPVCQNIPVVRKLLRAFEGAGMVGKSDKGYTFRGTDYADADFMEAFCRRYNVSRREVIDCERWMDSLPSRPLVLVHPLLDRMLEIDEADIDVRGSGIWPEAPALTTL